MSLPRYSMCKDSGMEWLGEVPSDWEVRRIRFPFRIKKRIAATQRAMMADFQSAN
jgi:type I restriction enzyme S subunit